MRKAVLCLLVLPVLLLSGCKSKGEMKGQVFVATQGGQNIKMGAVVVRAVKEEVVKKRIAALKNSPAYAISLKADDAKVPYNAAYEKYMTALKRSSYYDTESDKDELERLKVDYETKSKHYMGLLKELEGTSPSDTLFKNQPDAVASAISDADGNFALELPREGRFVVMAQASRKLPDNEEQYFWLVPVSLSGKDSEQLLLSNNNMLDGSDLKALIAGNK